MTWEDIYRNPAYIYGTKAPVSAIYRAKKEDFFVEEIPAYLPAGHGDHLFVWIEKCGLTTAQACSKVAERLGVKSRDIGTAGLKDKWAVTRQWLSLPGATAASAMAIQDDDLRVLHAANHPHKLRTGHLRGNRFCLQVLEADRGENAVLQDRWQQLQTFGLPNFYGPQRFRGDVVRHTVAWVQGTQRPPRAVQARKFGISALQAAWFNVWLSRRMATLPLHGILPGDVLRREDSGGLFVCCEPAVDAARATAWELSPTGPIWGPKMPMPTGEALAFEQTVMTEVGAQALIPRLGRWGRGTRRAARVPLKEARLVWREKALELRFVLPPGAYATQVLHQLFHGGAQEAVDGLAASAHPA